MTDEQLVKQAQAMLDKAYAPYSGFRVGAALLCEDGRVYTGCNIENASYGGSICAERAAVAAAVSDGNRNFSKLAVISSGDKTCMPCGICRQVLFEFSKDLTVLCADGAGHISRFSIKELLPAAFE